MKEFWNTIQLIFTAIGGWLGYFLGGCDGLMYALTVKATYPQWTSASFRCYSVVLCLKVALQSRC